MYFDPCQRSRLRLPQASSSACHLQPQVVRALSEVLGARLPYDSHAGVRARLAEVAPHFAHVSAVQVSGCENGTTHCIIISVDPPVLVWCQVNKLT